MKAGLKVIVGLVLLGVVFDPFRGWADEKPTPSAKSPPVSVPIVLARGRVMVPATVNGSKPLSLLLDTGYGISMIHPDLVPSLGLKRVGQITIVGIAGEEEAGAYSGAVFDLGGFTYAPRRVASLPSEARASHRRRDGILGAGFFRRFVVEIDSRNKTLRLHEPKSFEYGGAGEVIPLQFTEDTPIIEAALVWPGRALVRGRFEVDTGCDDGLCLGRDFVDSQQLKAEEGTGGGTKQGVGGGAQIRQGSVAQLQLGRFTLDKPPVNFFTEGSPAGKGCAGHIGMAALGHFKVIFDYSRRRMIIADSQ